MSIAPPTAEQLAAAAQAFDRDWGSVDEVLYRLCAESPGHTDRRATTAKLALIGRAYSAGLERCVTPPPGQQAITVLADYMHARGVEVDAVVEKVLPLSEPLSTEDFRDIVSAHGAFLALLGGVTRPNTTPRSFAAKYLHFHNPVVPIYDEYVRSTLSRLVRWDAGNVPFPLPSGADRIYWEFCVRFARLYEVCWDARVQATVKALDQYLWSMPWARS